MSVLFTITLQHLVQFLAHSRCSLNICGMKEYAIALEETNFGGGGGGGGWVGAVWGCVL